MTKNKLNHEVMRIFYENQKDVEDVINIFYPMASLGEMMRNPYYPYTATIIKDSGVRIK